MSYISRLQNLFGLPIKKLQAATVEFATPLMFGCVQTTLEHENL